MLRYLSLQVACDITFGIFLISWVATRHILFIKVIISAYSDAPRLIPFDWIPERGYYLTHDVYVIFVSLLVSLEVRATPHPPLTIECQIGNRGGLTDGYTFASVLLLDHSKYLVLPYFRYRMARGHGLWSGRRSFRRRRVSHFSIYPSTDMPEQLSICCCAIKSTDNQIFFLSVEDVKKDR